MMEITGLDKIKNMDDNDNAEINVTGLDFITHSDSQTTTASGEEVGFDFIKKLETEPGADAAPVVTGLEFISKPKLSSGDDPSVSGLHMISREKDEDDSSTAAPEGLDSIKPIEFSDIGIKHLD